MRKINQHIEIVSSTNKGLSSMSQQSRLLIKAALAEHYTHVGITIVNNLSDLEDLVARRPDLVFLGMKYIPEEVRYSQQASSKIWLSKYLDMHDIVHTGSGHLAHALELDKSLAKRCIQQAGLNTAPFIVARQNKQLSYHEITPDFPVFIKPTDRGGGAGVDMASLANNFEELQAKVESVGSNFQADSLIEEYLPGREFSVAILKKKQADDYFVMPLELVAPADINGDRFLSSKIKNADLEIYKTIANGSVRKNVKELAINAFHALGARDYGRIDIRLDESGTAHFLEANLIPSLLKDYGNFPKACMSNMQIDYETMLLRIVDLALARTSIVDAEDFSLGLNIGMAKIVPELI